MNTAQAPEHREQPWLRILTHIQFWALAAFIISSPNLIYGFQGGLGLVNFNLRFGRLFLILALLATSASLVARWFTGSLPKIRFMFFDGLLGVYVVFCLISGLVKTPFPMFTTRFFGLVECILIYALIRVSFTSVLEIRRLAGWMAASSLLVLAAGYHQLYTVYYGIYDGPLFKDWVMADKYARLFEADVWTPELPTAISHTTRLSSSLGEPNMAGGFLAACLPLIFYFSLAEMRQKKTFQALALASLIPLTTIAIIATTSKSALLSLLAGVAVFGFGVLKSAKKTDTFAAKKVFFACLGIMSAGVVWYLSKIKMLLDLRLKLGDNGHISIRLHALEQFWKSPWLGLGYANYGSVHTIVLTNLVELGVLGGAIVLVLFFQPILRWLSKGDETPPLDCDPWLGWSLAASYCSVLVGLYCYDYLLYPFVWITTAAFISYRTQLNPVARAESVAPESVPKPSCAV